MYIYIYNVNPFANSPTVTLRSYVSTLSSRLPYGVASLLVQYGLRVC